MKWLALVFVVLAAAASGADYPMFRGDVQRLGRSAEKLSAPAKLLWKKDLNGEIYSSPAIVSGTAYFGNSNQNVYAYDLKSGEQKWKARLPERIYGSSPQVEGGLLSIACVDGCIYTLNAADGAQKGKICVKKRGLLYGPDILGSPLLSGGKLYFGSDNGEIYCFRQADGEKLWSFDAVNRVHDSAAALMGNALFMGSTDGRVYALDKESGKELWKSDDFDKINSTPLAYNGKLYIGAADRAMRCLDAGTGAVVWTFKTRKGIMSSPALSADGTRLVFGGGDGNVYCLGLDGSLKWKQDTGGPVLASPLITGETVWIGSFDSHFYGIQMADGKKIFDLKCAAGVFSSAAASEGRILFGDRDGGLFCIQATLN